MDFNINNAHLWPKKLGCLVLDAYCENRRPITLSPKFFTKWTMYNVDGCTYVIQYTLLPWLTGCLLQKRLLLQIWSQDVLSLLSMPPLFPVLFVLGSPWNNARTAGANMFKKGKISLEYPHFFFNPELEIPDRSMFNLQFWVDFISRAFNLQPCTIIQCSIPISICIYIYIYTYSNI